jgi:hypothetical protein
MLTFKRIATIIPKLLNFTFKEKYKTYIELA